MAQAVQGSGRVTIPVGVQEMWRCGTEGHGQWAQYDGLGLDMMILKVFNVNDSMTKCSYEYCSSQLPCRANCRCLAGPDVSLNLKTTICP